MRVSMLRLVGGLFGTFVALVSSTLHAQPRKSPAACFPGCRTGYVCNGEGQCVSACNPPCGAGEQCTLAGECVAASAASSSSIRPPAVTPAPTPLPPPASAPVYAAPAYAAPTPPPPQAAPATAVASSDAPTLGAASAAPPAQAPAPTDHTPALASTGGHGVRVHDGFYFGASLGGGALAGGNLTLAGGGQNVNVSGGGVTLQLAFGGTLPNGLVLGGAIYGASVPTPSYSMANGSQVTNTTGGGALLSSIGPFADWYFDPTKGFHALFGFGFATIAAAKGTQSPTFPPADEGGNGGSVVFGFGYDWWVGDQLSLGVLGRVQYVSGSVKASGDSTYTGVQAFVPSLELSLAYN